MSKKILHNTSGLVTAEDVASIVGITVQSVYRKQSISEYKVKEVPSYTGKGRPTVLYDVNCLKLWDALPSQYEASMQTNRKQRTDIGKPRSIEPELWEVGVKMIKSAYINNALRDCRYICEKVCSELHQLGYPEADADKFYKAIIRKEPKRNKYGVFYTDPEGNWEVLRQRNRNRAQYDLESGTAKYDRISILTKAGLAGEGFGACRIIVIDDFKRDAWVNRDGSPTMPEGLAFIDGLTGFPLLYLPVDTVTTSAVARGILLVAYNYGLYDDTVWVIENSRAMKNVNINGLIGSLYTQEQLDAFKDKDWITALFGSEPAPIVHSVPHVPRHVAKAVIESHFNRLKHEYDAVNYALQFQGGNRSEAVTLTRARMPYFTNKNLDSFKNELKLVEYDEYWRNLYHFVYADEEMSFIDRVRPKFRKIAAKLGVEPTMRGMFDYFNSENGRETPELSIERYAKVLFYAQPERTKPHRLVTLTTKNRSAISCTIDNNTVNLISQIFINYIGHRVAVLPIPTDANRYAVILADNENIELIGVFKNQVAYSLEDAKEFRATARKVRETQDKQLDQAIERHKLNPATTLRKQLPNKAPLLHKSKEVAWIEALKDEEIEHKEVNVRSRAVDFEPKEEEIPKINFINNRKKMMLEQFEASLEEITI